MKKLIRSFGFALQGLGYALKTQTNLKIHFMALGLVCLLGIWVKLIRFEWAIIFTCAAMVISAELLNSALEKTLDKLHPGKDEAVKRAKDMAAAAVFIAALFSVIVAVFIFWEKLKMKF